MMSDDGQKKNRKHRKTTPNGRKCDNESKRRQGARGSRLLKHHIISGVKRGASQSFSGSGSIVETERPVSKDMVSMESVNSSPL